MSRTYFAAAIVLLLTSGYPRDLEAQAPAHNLVAVVSGTTVSFSWHGTAPDWLIEAGSSPGSAVFTARTGSASPAFVVNAVPTGVYFVRIRSYTAGVLGPPSNEVQVVVGTPPGVPRPFSAVVQGSMVVFLWSPPDAGDPPTAYVLEAGSAFGLGDLARVTLPAASTTFSVGPVPMGRYFVRLYAMNAAGVSAASPEAIVDIGPVSTFIRRLPVPLPSPGSLGDSTMSADGSTVAFVSTSAGLGSDATLVVENLHTSARVRVDVPGTYLADPKLSNDGRELALIVFAPQDRLRLYRWSPWTGSLRLTHPSTIEFPFGIQDDLNDATPDLRSVLVRRGVFDEGVVIDTDTGRADFVMRPTSGAVPNGNSTGASITPDGRYVSFTSDASNLLAGDLNGVDDIYIFDRFQRGFSRASRTASGAAPNGPSSGGLLSNDGRYVAYASTASNVVPSDVNGASDVFVFDRVRTTTALVSKNTSGATAGGASTLGSLDGSGRCVVYESAAPDIVPNDTNGVEDVFVHDPLSGQTRRISVAVDGGQANGRSSPRGISDNCRYVLISSSASNLVPGDDNGQDDLFVIDLALLPPP